MFIFSGWDIFNTRKYKTREFPTLYNDGPVSKQYLQLKDQSQIGRQNGIGGGKTRRNGEFYTTKFKNFLSRLAVQ